MSSNRQVLIATDIENFDGCARQDPELRRYPRLSVLHASVSAIERVTREQYPHYEIAWRITAFSSAESDSAQEYRYRALALKTLNALGYRVESVIRSPNAADKAITSLAAALIRGERRIKACVLATQDSGTDFVEFLHLIRARTLTHLIGYDYVPDTFQAMGPFPFSRIKEDVVRILEARFPGQTAPPPCARTETPPPRTTSPATPASIERSAPPAPVPPAAHSPRPNIRDSARAFLTNKKSLTDADHYAWMEQAIICMQKTVHDAWEGTPAQSCIGA